MNKSQTATIGAVLLAVFAFHGAGSGTPGSGGQTDQTVPTITDIGMQAHGDGPWVASCEYWAPEREAPAVGPPSETSLKITGPQPDGSHTVTLSSKDENDSSDCKDPWGLPPSVPSSGSSAKPKITTIIATVPDPVHTNMVFQFDRTIDAIIDAAADNGYQSSYYWLPWKKEPQKTKDKEGSASETIKGEQEREPGLIIFKPGPLKKNATSAEISDSFRSALYLFLIGETPTSGINAYQMERALKHEDDLKKISEFAGSTEDPDELDIIGPIFSGSAVSLRRAIDKRADSQPVIVSGITATPQAADLLRKDTPLYNSPPPSNKRQFAHYPHDRILYQSFDDNFVYEDQCIVRFIEASGIKNTEIAELIEDGTTLGQLQASNLSGSPIVIRFPREISLLRNAQTEQAGSTAEQESAPSPYLHLSLKGSNAYDSVPHLDREITPLSQESQLMAIQHQLESYHTKYIIISATNVLDELFLAQFLHRAVPDARLVFEGGDLLFEREIDDVPFIGAITVSPYQLTGLSTAAALDRGIRAFPDWGTIAYYNAASYTLWDSYPEHGPFLVGYQDIFKSDQSQVTPPLWVTTVGTNNYYPLGMASPIASDTDRILPPVPQPKSSYATPSRPRKLPIRPSLTWDFLCLFVFLLCAGHAVFLTAADYWSPFTRDLAIDQNDQPSRRSMSIHIGAVMLFFMAFVAACPIFIAYHLIKFQWLDFLVAVVTLAGGCFALCLTLIRTARYWKKLWRPDRTRARGGSGLVGALHELVRTIADLDKIALFNLIARATLIFGPLLWLYCLLSGLGLSKYGLFFAYRCLNPAGSISTCTHCSPAVQLVPLVSVSNVEAAVFGLQSTRTPRQSKDSDFLSSLRFRRAIERLRKADGCLSLREYNWPFDHSGGHSALFAIAA